MNADIIVIGGGLAGLVTACRASELGLEVLVLEQGSGADYLCNSRVTGGVVHFASESLLEPAEMLAEKVTRITGGFVDPALAATIAGDAHRALDWLRAQGARFARISPLPRHQWVMAPLRMARPALDPEGWRGRSGDALLRQLTDILNKRGSRIVLNTKAEQLIFEGGRCVGVEATRDADRVSYRGRAIVLADGGFQGDDELVGRFIAKRPERVQRRNAGTGTGDAVRMLEAAGAKLVGMEYFYGHLLSRDAMSRDDLWPYPGLDALAVAGIVVDGRGTRFLDEGLGGVYLSNAIAWSDDPLDAWVVFDEKIWNGPGKEELFLIGANPVLVRLGGTMFKADSLAALEAEAGFSGGSLAATVEAYNAALDCGAPDRLEPRRSVKTFAAHPIRTPPFYAVPLCAGLTFTMGGGAVDADMRVLREDGSAIAGLYAAGKSLGGLEGGKPVGYVGGLSLGLITGLRAAEGIAKTERTLP
jgi:fumarate reductase flavoprotein subunit